MITMDLGLRGQTTTEGLVPAKAARFAALLGALVLMSAAINGLAILGDSKLWQQSSNPAACSQIAEQTDRLACYDKLAHGPVRHPFKGANAPAFSNAL